MSSVCKYLLEASASLIAVCHFSTCWLRSEAPPRVEPIFYLKHRYFVFCVPVSGHWPSPAAGMLRYWLFEAIGGGDGATACKKLTNDLEPSNREQRSCWPQCYNVTAHISATEDVSTMRADTRFNSAQTLPLHSVKQSGFRFFCWLVVDPTRLWRREWICEWWAYRLSIKVCVFVTWRCVHICDNPSLVRGPMTKVQISPGGCLVFT